MTHDILERLRDWIQMNQGTSHPDEQLIRDAAAAIIGGWQPIETAPKDGTWIDLWADDHRQADCYWYVDDDGYDGWRQVYPESRSNSFPLDGDPTYWRPRPEPPPCS